MLRYFVVEPLDDDETYQVWRVALVQMDDGEEPDPEDGMVVSLDGVRWTWRWTPMGDPLIGTKNKAKEEAFKLWYP